MMFLLLAASCGGESRSSGGEGDSGSGSGGTSVVGGTTSTGGATTGGSGGIGGTGTTGGAGTGNGGTTGTACELEAAALWDFKSRNDACETSSDCTTEFVGCNVTEDGCTGAVYYAADFDRAEFQRLRDEYYSCSGTCGACRRPASPPGCVSGHCQILPTR